MNAWKYMKLFLVLTRISHSFALLTREISWSTIEIYFIFPHNHVLFSIKIAKWTEYVYTRLKYEIKMLCSFLIKCSKNLANCENSVFKDILNISLIIIHLYLLQQMNVKEKYSTFECRIDIHFVLHGNAVVARL